MNVYQLISSNKRKTGLIIGLFIIFIGLTAYLFGMVYNGYGQVWLVFALMMSLSISLVSFYFGDQAVIYMNGARPADSRRDFNFYTIVDNLCIATGIPKPKLYVIESPAMNAFATGRDPQHASVCATRGLLERLDRSDIEGVVAHELSHVKNFDIRLMMIVAVLVGTVAYLSNFFLRSFFWGSRSRDSKSKSGGIIILLSILLAIITPVVATLIQLAVSRRREFLADASAVLITRNPQGLADALEKIKTDSENLATVSNGTAHLFFSNPFNKNNSGGWLIKLFNTHPPIEERIKLLRSM